MMEPKKVPTHNPNQSSATDGSEKNQTVSGNPSLKSDDRKRIEQIWAERAAQMAKVEVDENAHGEQMTVVLLRLGQELLGMGVQHISEIRARETITRVPRVPNWVVGITNLRGSIYSVIDLRRYFGLPGSPLTPDSENPGLLVVAQSEAIDLHAQNAAMKVVFLVDDVLSIETLILQQTAEDSGLIHGLKPEYIHAIAERRASATSTGDETSLQKHVVILDTEALLNDPRLVIHEEIN